MKKTIPIPAYNPNEDMLKVCSMQRKFRDSFPGSSLNPAYWESSLGAGGTIAVAGGALTLGSGTTINGETRVISKEMFTIPFRLGIGMTLSQRIIDQSFYVELVSVDRVTGIPDGLHKCGWLFDGTSATQAKYIVQNSGITELVSAASTVPTTASGSYYEVEPFADECWFHGGGLDSSSGRSNSYRRHQQIPDPNAVYKLSLRWKNGATAPASNTNAVIQYVSLQDYAELTAEITAGRGQSVAGQALGVQVLNSITPVALAVNAASAVIANGGTYANLSSTNLTANATYTSSVIPAFSTAYNDAKFSHILVSVLHQAGTAAQHGTLFVETYDTTSTTSPTSGQRITYSVPVPSDNMVHTYLIPVPTKYFRVNFKNGGTGTQTAFNLSYMGVINGSQTFNPEKNIPFLLSTTVLAASASFTSAVFDLGVSRTHQKMSLVSNSAQSGTLALEQSFDNSTWLRTHSVVAAAGAVAMIPAAEITMRYLRVVYINDATLQTNFRLHATIFE